MSGEATAIVNHIISRRAKLRRPASMAPISMESVMIKKLVIALGAAGLVFTVSACNTVKGVGRDIQSVGEAGERAIK